MDIHTHIYAHHAEIPLGLLGPKSLDYQRRVYMGWLNPVVMERQQHRIVQPEDTMIIPISNLLDYANALLGKRGDEGRVGAAMEIIHNIEITRLMEGNQTDMPSQEMVKEAHGIAVNTVKAILHVNSMMMSDHEEVCE